MFILVTFLPERFFFTLTLPLTGNDFINFWFYFERTHAKVLEICVKKKKRLVCNLTQVHLCVNSWFVSVSTCLNYVQCTWPYKIDDIANPLNKEVVEGIMQKITPKACVKLGILKKNDLNFPSSFWRVVLLPHQLWAYISREENLARLSARTFFFLSQSIPIPFLSYPVLFLFVCLSRIYCYLFI